MSQPSNRIPAAEAAQLLGIPYPTTFYRLLGAQQMVYDQFSGLQPYPAEHRGEAQSDCQRSAKKAYDRDHALVVVEWGGLKPAGGSWAFDRHRCEAFRDRGLDAVLEARRAWGLKLSGHRPRSGPGADQESRRKRGPKAHYSGERPD